MTHQELLMEMEEIEAELDEILYESEEMFDNFEDDDEEDFELDAEIEEALFDLGIADDQEELEEKTIVKLDKKAQFNKLLKQAAVDLAKSKNDPAYKIYAKAYEMKEKTGSAILAKYKGAAASIVRKRMQDKKSPNGKAI